MRSSSSGFPVLLVAILSTLTISVSARAHSYTCLPTDIKADETVRVVEVPSRSGDVVMKTITVANSLKSIKAKCVKGKLVDGRKKQVKFFRIEGCWGNPPADYQEIQVRQRQELAALKRKYTVIEMSCNTGTLPLSPPS